MEKYCASDSIKGASALIQALRTHEHAERALMGSARVGLSLDEASGSTADDATLLKLNTGLVLSRGGYPGELEFTSNVGVTLADGVFREDVSTFGLSYDDYLRPWLEAYGFAERFSDAFLGIDQRYELGGGTVIELAQLMRNRTSDPNSAWLTTGGLTRAERLKTTVPRIEGGAFDDQVPAWLKCSMVAQLGTVDPDSTAVSDWVEAHNARVKRIGAVSEIAREANRLAHSKVRIALLGGLMVDVEKATVSALDTLGSEVSLPLSGTHTLRWVLRPTLEWRPRDSWGIRADYYLKNRLEERPWGDDYRSDLQVALVSSFNARDFGQAGSVRAELRYRRLFDSAPPTATAAHLADPAVLLALPNGTNTPRARSQRHYLVFQLAVSF